MKILAQKIAWMNQEMMVCAEFVVKSQILILFFFFKYIGIQEVGKHSIEQKSMAPHLHEKEELELKLFEEQENKGEKEI